MNIYSDIRQAADLTATVVDEEAIGQALATLLLTEPGERLFFPEYGAGLENLLYEAMDNALANQIYDRVIGSIERWEPRVILNQSLCFVTPNYVEHTYEVSLVFAIAGLGTQRFERQFSLSLQGGQA
jgi:hypothetical protein